MNYLEKNYTPEQIETAREVHQLLKEYSRLTTKIEMLGNAVKQTALADTPDDILPEMSNFPLAALLHGGPLPPHPLFLERYRLAKILDEGKDDKELKEEIIDNMAIETLLLGSDARRIMERVRELGANL